MVEIFLEKATKYFGDVRAIEDITLKIRSKELMVLLGPSGCGKTTTLRLIAGLERLTRGKIYIGDRLVDDAVKSFTPPRYRKVSMVFQSYALFPHMNVYQNIAFPAVLAKWSKSDIRKRVLELAEMFGIKELLNRKPHQLSAGQQQRVALARALVIQPEILLLDEPLANLDAKLRTAARAMIKRLHLKFGCTTVYVTHDQIEAMAVADRIAVLNEGILQQVGSPDELYTKPANTFIADFIGSPSMNIVECTFDEEKSILDFGIFHIKVPENISKALKGCSDVIFGVRPERIEISPSRIPDGVEMEVYVVEPLGDRNIVTVSKGEISFKVVTPPTFKVDIGTTVWLKFNINDIHIFDKKTGKAII
ncbi:MAG: sugar ABC transporter ATP-binding protein [Thermoprotei archaeon]|nr:MAG: sugar ABC transporter ATP-binding protein [Thermoprotei archaeon]